MSKLMRVLFGIIATLGVFYVGMTYMNSLYRDASALDAFRSDLDDPRSTRLDALKQDVLERTLNDFGIQGEMRAIYQEHFDLLEQNEVYQAALLQELASKPNLFSGLSPDEIEIVGRQYGIVWATGKIVAGLKRLSPEDLRTYFKFSLGMFEGLQSDVCVAMLGETLPAEEVAKLETAAVTQLRIEEATEILAINRRALFAEIADDPKFEPLTDAQLETVQLVLGRALNTALDEHPRGDTLAEDDLCEYTKLVLETVLGIQGSDGDLTLKLLMSE